MRVIPALGLEDADRIAFTLDSVILIVDGDEELVEENHGGSIFGGRGKGSLGGFHGPVGRGLGLGRNGVYGTCDGCQEGEKEREMAHKSGQSHETSFACRR